MSRAILAIWFALGAIGLGGCETFPFGSPECDQPTVLVEVEDFDRDGHWGSIDDCDEGDPSIHAGARDVPDDGIDQDCDGVDASLLTAGAACLRSRPALFGENPGETSRSRASVASTCGGAGASAVVFVLTPTGAPAGENRVSLLVESEAPHVVHVRGACLDGTTELGCALAGDDALELEADVDVPLFVVVTAVGEPGPFILVARQEPR